MNKRITAIVLLLAIFMLSSTALANSAAPIDIEIDLENIPKGAFVDILVKDVGLEFDDKNNSVIERYDIDCKNSTLYNYNEDGYLALGVRSELIEFEFYNGTYSGLDINVFALVPNGFKVIVQTDDNEIFISDHVEYPSLRGKYKYDFSTNELKYARKQSYGGMIILAILAALFVPLILTIVIEVIVALIMKIKGVKKVIVTNIWTNILMNILLLIFALSVGFNYFIMLLVLEILVVFVEYQVYKNAFKDEHTEKFILTFAIIANVSSLVIPLVFGLIM